MGVDFYTCKYCGDTFPDCGDYTGCECGEHWCCDECAEAEGYRVEPDGFTYKTKYGAFEHETSCNYCRKEDFEDLELLNFLIKSSNSSREEVIEAYKEWKTGKGDD